MPDPDAKALLRDALAGMVGESDDLGYMTDSLPALTLFLSEFAAPDFVCVMAGAPPAPEATYPGVEGLADAWSDWGSAFESVRAELEDIRESQDHLVVLVNQIATTRHGGVEITQPSAMVFAFEDGRVARLEFHLDREAALRSARIEAKGLSR